jgi:hypothetical protein
LRLIESRCRQHHWSERSLLDAPVWRWFVALQVSPPILRCVCSSRPRWPFSPRRITNCNSPRVRAVKYAKLLRPSSAVKKSDHHVDNAVSHRTKQCVRLSNPLVPGPLAIVRKCARRNITMRIDVLNGVAHQPSWRDGHAVQSRSHMKARSFRERGIARDCGFTLWREKYVGFFSVESSAGFRFPPTQFKEQHSETRR